MVEILAYQFSHTKLLQDTGTLRASFNFVEGLIVLDKQNSNLNNFLAIAKVPLLNPAFRFGLRDSIEIETKVAQSGSCQTFFLLANGRVR